MELVKKLKKKLKFPWYIRYGTCLDRYINIWIENPFNTWWKARKYFKRPKISFHLFFKLQGNSPYINDNNVGKILDIEFHDVGWKDKWDSPRHETDPYIWVCFFKTFGFSVRFNIYYYNEFGEKENGNMHYWEYLLYWLYYKNKKSLRCYSNWTRDSQLYSYVSVYGDSESGSDDEYKPYPIIIPEVAMSLNKNGRTMLKQEIAELREKELRSKMK
jgi:hypothetical protein